MFAGRAPPSPRGAARSPLWQRTRPPCSLPRPYPALITARCAHPHLSCPAPVHARLTSDQPSPVAKTVQCSLARPPTLVKRPTCPQSYLIKDSSAWLPHTPLY